MSDDPWYSWSHNPNAPKIDTFLHNAEKLTFVGFFFGAVLYGILAVLFFKCMSALLSPARRQGEAIKWGLVTYTALMFSMATVYTAMNLNIQILSFIDNREFSAAYPDGTRFLIGPILYQTIIRQTPLGGTVPNIMFSLNNWLADGLLLYRCYILFSMNLWAIVFPCLMYIVSIAMCVLMIVDQVHASSTYSWAPISERFGIPYFSISVSLNVLLTLMIVVRLVVYGRKIRVSAGSPVGITGLYKTIATMLIESCALFAVSSLLFIGLLATANPVSIVFFPILTETQVIAPLLVIQRVANKSALTGNSTATGPIGSVQFRSQGASMGESDATSGGRRFGLTGMVFGKSMGDSGVKTETTIEFRRGSSEV